MSISIHFDEIEGIYSLEGDGPVQNKKFLSIEDVKSLFEGSVLHETGLLPKNCIYHGVDGSKYFVIIEVPASKRPTLLRDRQNNQILSQDVPIPNLVFGFYVEGEMLRTSYCFSTQMGVTGLDTPLYHFPLGNVFDDGRICWGNADVSLLRTMFEISQLPHIFFEAPFNGDLYNNANSSGEGIVSHFNTIKELNHYPVSHLKAARQMPTVRDLLEQLRRAATN